MQACLAYHHFPVSISHQTLCSQLPGILSPNFDICKFYFPTKTRNQLHPSSSIAMRLPVAAVAISLVVGALADFSGRPPQPPPPGSACLDPSDKYRPPKTSPVPATVVENEERSLGITSLPRQWARDLMSTIGERAEQLIGARCVSLQCACVHAGRKTSYGVYKKVQCPVQHGASWEACNVQEDGYTVSFPSLLSRY